MKKIVFGLTIILFLITACSKTLYVTSYKSTESREFEPRQGVVVTPLVADMKILSQKPVEDSVTFKIFVTTIPSNQIASWVSECKKEALSVMIKKYKADAIVAPLTDVTTTSEGYMKIHISGYPAKYENFRNATAADTWMVPMYNIIDKNASEPLNSLNTKISIVK
jgi:hypothetical protein